MHDEIHSRCPRFGKLGRRRRRSPSLLVGLALALVAFGAPPAALADSPTGRQNVLLLYGESRVLPAVLDLDEAIRTRFAQAGVEARFFSEYLDLSWASDPHYLVHVRAFLRSKYREHDLNVVVALGPLGLRFALDSRADLFPQAPIVFAAVTPAGAVRLEPGAPVTGVWMTADAALTVAAARQLQPGAHRLVVVGGAARQDRIFTEDIRRDLARSRDALETSYLEGLPLEAVREALASLPPDTIVLLGSILRDGNGRTYSGRESLRVLAPASKAPLYGLFETGIGHGIVGGRLINFRDQGVHTADLVLRVLRGEPPQRIEPVGTTNTFVFDAQEIVRWGLAERDLPAGSVVLNRTPMIWTAYRWHLLGTASVIAAQGILIVALLSRRRRRRRAEAALTERLAFETLVSDLSKTLVELRGPDLAIGLAHGLRRVAERLRVERGSIIELTPLEEDARITHEWVAPGVPPLPSSLDVRQFAWALGKLRSGERYCFSRLDELPAEAARDRDAFARLGVRSGVGVPLAAGGRLIGAFTLATIRREQEWPKELLSRIEFVGSVFATAMSRRRDEMELQALRRDLTHVGRVASMGELAASIAHELNQPLTAILNNAQVAHRLIERGEADAPELKDILADIVADDRRAGDVIRRLRAFVKKDEAQRLPVDVNVIVQDVVALVRSDATVRNLSVATGLTLALPPVLGDRVQLQQVILNLVMNGLDAMREAANRALLISTEIDVKGAVCVVVTDHGCGIPEGDLRRVFEPFYTTKSEGMGMGLAIARSLVESHGGQLWVENRKEGGARFTFTLPAADGEAA
jgi:C4-dicarboxylate-specific signal transduction histidine kinase